MNLKVVVAKYTPRSGGEGAVRFRAAAFAMMIAVVCVLVASGVLSQQAARADGHGCPSSWPDQAYEGFHTDEQGKGWYVIRKSDSNGYTTVRAYAADDGYASGYRSGSTDEICFLAVRSAGDSEDAVEPKQIAFTKETEEPARGSGSTSGGGGAGSGRANADQTNVVTVLAAALEITRHAYALNDVSSVRTDRGMTPESFRESAREIARRSGLLNQHLATLTGKGHAARVGRIRTLANRLVANAGMIQTGRRALGEALLLENTSRVQLSQANATRLFPATDASVDDRFYHLVTNAGDGSAGSGNLSKNDVLAYSHATSLASNMSLGHTLLLVASLMQDPTFVGRIREAYDSAAGRVDRDVEYLRDNPTAGLGPDILALAENVRDAGGGEDDYFVRLERRLELTVAENELIARNEKILDQLLCELDALAAVARGLAPEETCAPDDQGGDLPGVTANQIVFGQSAAFTGPSRELGQGMRLGIQAAFHEANQAGGVNGRTLTLATLDDGYEPDRAFANTRQLIEDERVFALIGEVGTPTSRAASPVAHAANVPFIGPFTGAQLLRGPELANTLNLRASYYQETAKMVDYLEREGRTKVAVLHQNDSYGLDGLNGVKKALEGRNMELVASWYYRRNTRSAVKSAVYRIAEAEPDAVIMVGTHLPSARAVELLREKLDTDPVFMSVSFVGSNALATALGAAGQGVFVTQVVPLPTDTSDPVVAKYQAALQAYDSGAVPGFISLEGYLAGRLAVEGLRRCGDDPPTRQCFLNAVQTAGAFNLDGFQLMFGATDNQGSDAVFLTQIDANGQYTLVP